MEQNLRVRFAKYLQHRPNFMKVGATAFGLLFGTALLWMLGSHGGLWWWLFLVALVIPASWLWAYCMWLVCGNNIRRISSDSTVQRANEGTRE